MYNWCKGHESLIFNVVWGASYEAKGQLDLKEIAYLL